MAPCRVRQGLLSQLEAQLNEKLAQALNGDFRCFLASLVLPWLPFPLQALQGFGDRAPC